MTDSMQIHSFFDISGVRNCSPCPSVCHGSCSSQKRSYGILRASLEHVTPGAKVITTWSLSNNFDDDDDFSELVYERVYELIPDGQLTEFDIDPDWQCQSCSAWNMPGGDLCRDCDWVDPDMDPPAETGDQDGSYESRFCTKGSLLSAPHNLNGCSLLSF
jgi:hypothetical protein